MKVKIFYSWQSTDVEHNKKFIYSCIRGAVKKINRTPEFKNIDFEITDAIRSEPGQIAIADSIIQKIIPDCDIFIADLTANRINWIARFISRSTPVPNPNVMTEYGVALNSLNKERIISVINISTNGSPRNNSAIIPFDIRQDRFPIEYDYSRKNEKGKETIKANLINDLANALKPTVQNVLRTQKSKFRPFIVWNDLNEKLNYSQSRKFIISEKFEQIKKNILNISGQNCIRILGLSGLGKTRILLEIFRPDIEDNNSLIFSNRLLYVNCNDYQEKVNFTEIIYRISQEKTDAIVVVDNCDLDTHRIISQNLKGLIFISIDSNPEENTNSEGTNYIIIGKNDLTTVVSQLVESEFQHIGAENIEKIKSFSQGIPLMAVLLADSIAKGEKFLGKLDEKELLDNLLGKKGNDTEWRNILRSCSMFSYFGFDGDLDVQFKFIATNENITISNNSPQVRINTFLEVINHFTGREIIEKQGRFLSIRPFPLAMALAVEWLDTCTSDRILKVIHDIANLEAPHKNQLINSLSDQMRYLGYNDKAVEIVEKIVGSESPFDNAEVLNTELGSRLFRSFVEVNPIAVSENFKRVLSNLPIDELLRIKEGRRNLVWILEKLCFDKRTFADSVKVLYSFAIAENETWANNATGQFLHLFNTHLSGTEASLKERWSIIEWGFSRDDKRYHDLAFEAMKAGLKFGHFSRMSGAELQGNKKLLDNEPTHQEIFEYWNNILNKLLGFIREEGEYTHIASELVANNIRGFFRLRMGSLILPYLRMISEIKNYDWLNGLNGLKHARKFEKQEMSDEILEETNSLINDLTKTDFSSKYLAFGKSYFLDFDREYSSEKAADAITELADEFIQTNVSWQETFPIFYKEQQVYSFYFGKRLAELLNGNNEKVQHFISYSLETILQIPEKERNLTILGAFIANSDEKIKSEFYNKLFQFDELKAQLFYFLSVDKSGYKYLDLLFKLIEDKACDILAFVRYNFSYAISDLTVDELEVLSEQFFKFGKEGYEVVFDLFFDIGYRDSTKKPLLLPIIKICILKLGYNRTFNRQLDDFKWTEAITSIISDETETEFAKFINKSIIESISWENSYHLDHYVQEIYSILLERHFSSIWDDLSKALLSIDDEYIKFYGLKHILGPHIGGIGPSAGLLFKGEIESIFKWCHNNRDIAPSRIAELIPIFDNNNSDYDKWNPIALRLLDEFGNLENVLSHLSSNMGTYSWTGSVVPFLEAKLELFNQLTNHKRNEVRQWAIDNIGYLEKEISIEKIRDEERFI